jgi:SAM-dependent methyltransferase
MESNIPCDLCGGKTSKPFLKLSKDHFALVQCETCSLVYLDPRPSPNEIGKYYTTDYYTSQAPATPQPGLRSNIKRLAYQAHSMPHDDGALERLKWKFLDIGLGWRAARSVPVRSKGRLLDVGCGNGEYAAWIRDNMPGWEAEGTEVNEHAAEQARRSFQLTVHTGHLNELHLAPSQFDMISFWHSLEHVFSPAAAVREAHRLLRPDGALAIEVPNIDSWEARRAGVSWYHLAVPVHLYHFSPTTLSRLVEQNGFQVLSLKHVRSNASLVEMLRAETFPVPSSLKQVAMPAAKSIGRLNAPMMRLYAVKNEPHRDG